LRISDWSSDVCSSDLLIRIHGADAIPLLVCAGRRGWRYDQIFARLESDPALKAHVVWIHDASDSELAALYRACAFTVYPSHYEGWGLPVTEALAHGQIPVIADNRSEEHTSEPPSLMRNSYAVFCLKKKRTQHEP